MRETLPNRVAGEVALSGPHTTRHTGLPSPRRGAALSQSDHCVLGHPGMRQRRPCFTVDDATGARATSQVLDHLRGELAAPEFGRAGDQAGQIVRHRLGRNGLLQALDDQVRRFGPAQIAEHHLA